MLKAKMLKHYKTAKLQLNIRAICAKRGGDRLSVGYVAHAKAASRVREWGPSRIAATFIGPHLLQTVPTASTSGYSPTRTCARSRITSFPFQRGQLDGTTTSTGAEGIMWVWTHRRTVPAVFRLTMITNIPVESGGYRSRI